MSRFFSLISFALFPAVSFAQTDSTPIANTGARASTSLNGKWRIIIDPFENGYYDFRLQPSKEGYFRDARPKDETERIEYDFNTSPQLDVPGDWNSQRDDLFFYEGTVWYRKHFDHSRKPGKRAFLYFGAANYEAIVFLNGARIGSHVGGFTPFAFEVTGHLKDGANSLVVKVDNKRRRDGVPTVNTDWWNYGGLTRGVALLEVPESFVEDYSIQLKKGSRDTIAGWVKINGPNARQKVNVRIPEAGINHTVTTDAGGRAEFSFPAKVALWSPENPRLYKVSVTAETDTVDDLIGFRNIEVKGLEILLNGRPVFLRGICIHEEAPIRAGRAFSQEDAQVLLGWAKELGCNFVRLAHYPHNEFMVREADRLGLMVWSEIPVYWTVLWESPETFANAQNQLTENITRDKNRASVILWSVANETPITGARDDFLRRLARQAKSLDSTRLVTAALLHHNIDSKTETREMLIDDPLGADLDVLGCNEYIGWYDGLPEKADNVTWKTIYDKPLIMSEFGGDALFGLHGDPLTRWTEEYQENVFQHTVSMLDRIPFLRGTAPWILMDFRSPRRTLPGIQDYFNRKGLVSVRGDKKKAFYVMQEYYGRKQAAQAGQK